MQPRWQQPFFQVALPLMITFFLATWYQAGRINDLRDSFGKRFDDMGKRIDDLRSYMDARFGEMNVRFSAIERRLDKLEEKVEGLLERSWC